MYRYLLSLLLLVSLCSTVVAGEGSPTIPDTLTLANGMKADAAYGVAYTEERVVALPQDQNKFYVTVMGSTSDSKYQSVLSWFNSVPELKSIKAQTHFSAVETTSAMFAERYRATVPNTPCIRVQSSDGTVLYQSSGVNVPMSGESLSKAINTECLRRWRNRNNATPEPDPIPDTNPSPDVSPDLNAQPDVAPVDNGNSLLSYLAAIGGGLFTGAGGMGVKKYRDKYKPGAK